MTLDIEAIKARCEAATEGPWDDDTMYNAGRCVNYALDPRSHVSVVMAKSIGDVALINNVFPETQQRANSSFIAHARQDLPNCLDEIERLRTLLRTISTKHNLLKGLSGYPPCSCKTNHMNLCMKHAAADILSMINDEVT